MPTTIMGLCDDSIAFPDMSKLFLNARPTPYIEKVYEERNFGSLGIGA